MKVRYVLLLLALMLVSPKQALARGSLEFGTQDTITEIQPLAGTDYVLCYKYHINYFIAGLYLSDDGYVLREKPKNDKHYMFTTPDKYLPLTANKISELQQSGLLPNPLPKYSIPKSAYVDGYALWGILLATVVLLLLRYLVLGIWDRYTAPDP